MTRPLCHRCGERALLRTMLNAGGHRMIAWYCLDCQDWAQSPVIWIKHDNVKQIIGDKHSIDDIPIYEDYRTSCDICGTMGAQLHHFFPQTFARHAEVFNDWPKWCKFSANLCQYHHDLWHDLVTPYFPGRGNSRRNPQIDTQQVRKIVKLTSMAQEREV